MPTTIAEADTLGQFAAEAKKAIQAGKKDQAEKILKGLANRTALHGDVSSLEPTEVRDFTDIHMGERLQKDEHRSFQNAADDLYIVGSCLGLIKRVGNGEDAPVEVHPTITGLTTFRRLKRDFPKLCEHGMKVVKAAKVIKALHSTGAGVGDEWVPTQHSPTLQDAVRLAARVASLIRLQDMPTDPFPIPVRGALPEAVILTEATSDSPANIDVANPATASVTLNAQKVGFSVPFSTELVEDSIIAILPWLRDEIRQAMAHSLDTVLLNGDTTGPHMDNDTAGAAANNIRKLWKGLRRLAKDGPAQEDASGGFTLKNIRNLRATMDKYAATPSDLALVTSVSGAMRLLGLAEVVTLEKYGPQATVLTGEIGRLDGISVVVSEDYRATLAATGVNTVAGPNTFTSLVLVNRRAYTLGQRRGVTLRSFTDARVDQDRLMVTARWDFQGYFPVAQKAVGQVIGIANVA